MQTKIDIALSVLKKKRWVTRDALVSALNETDLRTVRRLREYGYDVNVKRDKGIIKYQRV